VDYSDSDSDYVVAGTVVVPQRAEEVGASSEDTVVVVVVDGVDLLLPLLFL
jgi:hypothetical protein